MRNSYVFGIRQAVLHESRWNATTSNHIEFDRLPSYDTMMFQLYKWNYDDVYDDSKWNDIDPKDELYKKVDGELFESPNPHSQL